MVDEIPPEYEEYFWTELEYITALKKAEQKCTLTEASYLGQVGTINRDPNSKSKPQPFNGSKIMYGELDSLQNMIKRLSKHLSGEKIFKKEELENLHKEGFVAIKKKPKMKRVSVKLQNGQVMFRNVLEE